MKRKNLIFILIPLLNSSIAFGASAIGEYEKVTTGGTSFLYNHTIDPVNQEEYRSFFSKDNPTNNCPFPECNKMVKGRNNRKNHFRTHFNFYPFQCANCQEFFKTSNALNHHTTREKLANINLTDPQEIVPISDLSNEDYQKYVPIEGEKYLYNPSYDPLNLPENLELFTSNQEGMLTCTFTRDNCADAFLKNIPLIRERCPYSRKNNKKIMREHLRGHYPHCKAFQCDNCNTLFHTLIGVQMHIMRTHSPKSSS